MSTPCHLWHQPFSELTRMRENAWKEAPSSQSQRVDDTCSYLTQCREALRGVAVETSCSEVSNKGSEKWQWGRVLWGGGHFPLFLLFFPRRRGTISLTSWPLSTPSYGGGFIWWLSSEGIPGRVSSAPSTFAVKVQVDILPLSWCPGLSWAACHWRFSTKNLTISLVLAFLVSMWVFSFLFVIWVKT